MDETQTTDTTGSCHGIADSGDMESVRHTGLDPGYGNNDAVLPKDYCSAAGSLFNVYIIILYIDISVFYSFTYFYSFIYLFVFIFTVGVVTGLVFPILKIYGKLIKVR